MTDEIKRIADIGEIVIGQEDNVMDELRENVDRLLCSRRNNICLSMNERQGMPRENEQVYVEIQPNEEDQRIEEKAEIKEVAVDFLHSIDLEGISELAKKGHLDLPNCFSQIRRTFALRMRWQLSSGHVKMDVENLTIVEDWLIHTTEDFSKLVKLALTKIWNVKLCVHCNDLVFSESETCQRCSILNLIVYHDRECIICQDTMHPIVFRCNTCVDSQVCISCELKRETRDMCTICRAYLGRFPTRLIPTLRLRAQ